MNSRSQAQASHHKNQRVFTENPYGQRLDPVTRESASLIPLKNGKARAAYYLGVVALIPGLAVLLGPFALVMGILGRRFALANPEAKGAIHAIAGIVLGSVTSIANVAAVIYLFVLGGWDRIISIEKPSTAEPQRVVVNPGFKMEPIDPLTSRLPPNPTIFYPKPQSGPATQTPEPLFSKNRDFVNPGGQVQSPDDPTVMATIRVSDADIEDLAFSRDGKTLAVMGESGSCLLNMQTSEYRPARPGVHVKAVSADNRWLVALQNQVVAAVYVGATGDLNKDARLDQDDTLLGTAAFSPDCKWLAEGFGQKLSIWDTATWKKRSAELSYGKYQLRMLVSSPDSRTLAFFLRQHPNDASSTDEIVLWDIKENREKVRLKCQGNPLIESLAFSTEGKLLAAGGLMTTMGVGVTVPIKPGDALPETEVIQLWDVEQSRPLRTLKGQRVVNEGSDTFPPAKLAFTPDRKILAGRGFDGRLWLWDLATGKRRANREGEHKPAARAMAISPDGKIIVTGGRGILVARDLAKMLKP